MALSVRETGLAGVRLLRPDVFADPRGFFLETFHAAKYAALGIRKPFVQDNHSHSRKGTVRGLHYQLARPQAKLVYVVQGEILDAVVDIRRGSPSFGKWVTVTIRAPDRTALYVPEGFAHGFCAISETVDVLYKCTDLYEPADEYGILWNDPALNIPWPVQDPILSEKDRSYPPLAEVPESRLPPWPGPRQPTGPAPRPRSRE